MIIITLIGYAVVYHDDDVWVNFMEGSAVNIGLWFTVGGVEPPNLASMKRAK